MSCKNTDSDDLLNLKVKNNTLYQTADKIQKENC